MLHRPTLMPASMRSANKNCSLSRSNDQLGASDYASPLLSSYLEDDEILVIEPTDPDEDRLKEQAKLQAEIDCSSTLIQTEPSSPPVLASTSEPSSTATVSESPSVDKSHESPDPISSTEARITICTDSGKPISVIPLDDALQSILSCTSRTTTPNIPAQPLVSATIAPTSYMISNPLGAVLLASPIQNNNTNVTFSNLTSTNQVIPPGVAMNPLVTAVLVNCATVGMMNQFAGTLCNSQTPSISEPNIVIAQPRTGSIIPGLFPGIAMSTTPTVIASNVGTNIVPVSLSNNPVSLVLSTGDASNQNSKDNKDNHVVTNPGRVKPFRCPVPYCERVFYSQYSQRKHIRFHTGERPFKCPESNCHSAFKRKRDLRDHWNVHWAGRPLTCATIEEEFEKALRQANERSMVTKTEPTDPNASLADFVKEFTNEFDNDEIECESLSECRRYYCTFLGCDKSYTRRYRLNKHIATHTGTGPIQCDQPNCNVRYFNAEDLQRHKMNHLYAADKNLRRKHVCTYPNCGKSYSKLNKLKEHLRSHTGERPYVCREPGCGASFIQLYGVKRHEMTHLYGRKRAHRLTRYPTTLAKVFGLATPRTRSKSSTSTAKPPNANCTSTSGSTGTRTSKSSGSVEVTQTIPVASSDSTILSASRFLPAIAPKTTKIKMRPISPIHGTPGVRRPHICPFKECGRAFPKLNKLREHICRHTGERPFACDKCPASFVRIYDLRRHNNVHLRAVETRIESRPLAPRGSCTTSVTTSSLLPVSTSVTTTNTSTSSKLVDQAETSHCSETIKTEPN